MAPIKLATTLARYFWRDRYKENCATNRNVINVSSISGLYVVPDCDQSVYSASKAALNYLTLHMANEFRPIGIRVNAAAPTSFPQAVSTESVADSIVRLDDGNMTGKILVLDQDGERFI
jgi:NAD(P)-dependent dehydrogenase (short-subunit alcohol dehydrogenase family)